MCFVFASRQCCHQEQKHHRNVRLKVTRTLPQRFAEQNQALFNRQSQRHILTRLRTCVRKRHFTTPQAFQNTQGPLLLCAMRETYFFGTFASLENSRNTSGSISSVKNTLVRAQKSRSFDPKYANGSTKTTAARKARRNKTDPRMQAREGQVIIHPRDLRR